MTTVEVQTILGKMYESISSFVTPGVHEFVATYFDSRAREWIAAKEAELDRGLQRDDLSEGDLTRLTDNIVLSWRRASERHAEQYYEKFRADGTPVGDMDLRFMRHINMKVVITFQPSETQKSPYFLFGRMPNEPPMDSPWATADDWLTAIESPGAISAIRLFGTYPINRKCLYRDLQPDEKVTMFWPENGRAEIVVVTRQGQVL